MRVLVDLDRCESNALCMGIAPEVFDLDDDDAVRVLDPTPPESMRGRVLDAIRSCPKQAISLEG